MNYTYATVIITADARPAAQTDLGEGFFNTALSADGNEPATHFMSSGPFNNDELQLVVNAVTWERKVYFGQDWQAACDAEELRLVSVSEG